MRSRRVFLILLLYIALVWVVVALNHEGAEIQKKGLFWTAVGIGTVLVLLALGPLSGLWRSWRAKRASHPTPAPQAIKPTHADDAAFESLWKDAERALAASPEYGGQGKRLVLRELPMYLLVGPSRVGKTSTFIRSHLDVHLLAGQVRGDAAVQATRVANIWIAQNALFIELSGRLFDGDISRWTEFLSSMTVEPEIAKSRWRVQQRTPTPRLLHGVVLFQNAATYSIDGNGAAIATQASFVQERLQAIAEVFSCSISVYTIFTHTDSVKFYEDFFRAMPEQEAGQAFGYLFPRETPASEKKSAAWADSESRRISKMFSEVSFRLAGRRVLHLTREEDPGRKRGVYEFPREFRRLRGTIAQFLTEAFRPNPLRPVAVLRGFFFSGKRHVSVDQQPAAQTRSDWTIGGGEVGVTNAFRAEATEIFRKDISSIQSPGRPASGFQERWMFVTQFFSEILLRDAAVAPAKIRVAISQPRFKNAIPATIAAAAVLLCMVWLQSWWGNRDLLQSVHAAAEATRTNSKASPSPESTPLVALQSLDQLRSQLANLRADPHLRVHWGLYVGDALEPDARNLYFRGFRDVVLEPLRQRFIAKLNALPPTPEEGAPFDGPYQILQTHVAISSRRCMVDPVAVRQVLKTEAAEAGMVVEGERQRLLDRQIDFYVDALRERAPLEIGEESQATQHGVSYLNQIKSPERSYRAILDQAKRTLATPAKLTDIAPDYARVLAGPDQVDVAFTPEGAKFVEREAKSGNYSAGADSCLLGTESLPASSLLQSRNAEMERAILALFMRDYKAKWKGFLKAFKMQPYRDAADAAEKLEILSAHKTPLLALLVMTANNTHFSEPEQETTFKESLQRAGGKVGLGGLLKKADKAEKAYEKAAKAAGPGDETMPVTVTAAFQPVHWVIPPRSDLWVNERNKEYVNALADLRKSMLDISRSTGGRADPAVHQPALAAYEKARDTVRQIAIGFKPVGSEGVDAEVSQLLEEPIRGVRKFIEDNPEGAVISKLNRDAATLCAKMRPVLQKYPFNASMKQEATLDEVSAFFAPGAGAIWKFQQESLGDFVVKQGKQWASKPDSKVKLSAELLSFLNRAEEFSNALYESGSPKMGLQYTLVPNAGMSLENRTLVFELDGKRQIFGKDSKIRKVFSWPAPGGASVVAQAYIEIQDQQIWFAKSGGPWGVFRVFGGAETRPLRSKAVEWKYVRGAGGEQGSINPPVRIDIAEFPGGVDLFNPAFFEGFRCTAKAVP